MNEVSINKQAKLSPHLASPSESTLSHSNELDGLHLSPHFTLGELTKTSYHTMDGNIPNRVAIENLKRICGWLEILRERYNRKYGDSISPPESGGVRGGLNKGLFEGVQTTPPKGTPPRSALPLGSSKNLGGEVPLVISSGYRSEEVNRKCGGAKGSNHLTGCAVDVKCLGPEQMIRYACLLLDTADENGWMFDELIQEKRGTTYWIHFAVRPKDNRRKILFDCR